MQCREIKELLSPYLDGMLSPSEGEVISSHLAVCPKCQADWHALYDVVNLFKNLPEINPPPGFSAGVINKIAAAPPRRNPGIATVFKILTRRGWARTIAFAATVVLTIGVTALMYGKPGQWGTGNLFLPQPSYNQKENQDSPDLATAKDKPDSSSVRRILNIFLTGSEPAGQASTEIADKSAPGKSGPADGSNTVSSTPTAAEQPEKPSVNTDSNRQSTSQAEQLNSRNLPEEQSSADSKSPPPAKVFAAPRTMAVKEGFISQQTAYGYIPVSNKGPHKVIRSASLSLAAGDPAGAPAVLAEIARSSGGYLLPEDSEGTVTIKAPADHINQVVNSIQGMGGATLQQLGGEDVTAKYSDYEAGLRELAAQEQGLLTALGNTTGTRADHARLTRVREDLERQKKKLKNLSNEVEMSTIKVNLEN